MPCEARCDSGLAVSRNVANVEPTTISLEAENHFDESIGLFALALCPHGHNESLLFSLGQQFESTAQN